MNIIHKKYDELIPTMDYLSDEVILSQSWKKTNNYIRRHNWYVDVLELDTTVSDIERQIEKYSSELKDDKAYKPELVKLVLAPKNNLWDFIYDDNLKREVWKTKSNMEQLRPLAHLSIKDQTYSSTIMSCLANAIESLQGSTEENNYFLAQKKGVFSYGNRLHCEWIKHSNKGEQANFNWGSSKTYRQYFEDYKKFLKRPQSICDFLSHSLSRENELFVVSLDLKKFYNNIDIQALLKELRKHYKSYSETYNLIDESDDTFWNKAKEIMQWNWDTSDMDEDSKKVIESSLGLPQGLVASGFFANAYMIAFDKLISKSLNKVVDKKNVKIIDYCRYVDDIRIVVEAPEEFDIIELKNIISKFVSSTLTEHKHALNAEKEITINESKTKIVAFRQMSNKSNLSSIMNMIQENISGTPDFESLQQVIGELMGILSNSNQEKNLFNLDSEEINYSNLENRLDLSSIYIPYMDIQDDTLKRFSATRLVKTLRMKKRMTVHDEVVGRDELHDSVITAGQLIDHEIESVARRLISIWSKNPSLSLLLKCGLDLYPDSSLLNPVIQALESKIFNSKNSSVVTFTEKKTAEYIISDLLRYAATNLGYKNLNTYPDSVNLNRFREELASLSKKVILSNYNFPWYVKQQAILFLIVNKDYGFDIKKEDKNMSNYYILRKTSLYDISFTNDSNDNTKILSIALVSQQISGNSEKFAYWFLNWINVKKFDMEEKKKLLKILLTNSFESFRKVLEIDVESKYISNKIFPKKVKENILRSGHINFKDFNGKRLFLNEIILANNNPFNTENAVTKLLFAILINKDTINNLKNGFLLNNLYITCNDWNKVQDPYEHILVEWSHNKTILNNEILNAPNQVPKWISTEKEWIYRLGIILRSCLVGQRDFTHNKFIINRQNESYKGLKTNSFIRKFSMINNSDGINNSRIPITPWLRDLLFVLLQWPGISLNSSLFSSDANINLQELKKYLKNRIDTQKKLFGKLSNTPIYKIPIYSKKNDSNTHLKVVTVQPLLPQMKDFNEKDPLNWSKSYREKHRNHLASICNLISKQVIATSSAEKYIEKNNIANVDIIIFPELTVNLEDIDLLYALSDKMKSHIFVGLTFHTQDKKIVNQSLWILRTESPNGREFVHIFQGKKHMTDFENKMNIESYRPYQILIEMKISEKKSINLSGAICYDATDLAIVADLRELSDVFIIAAMNRDVQTFDNMINYLHYHMYQPVILVNTGEFGGSSVQAPYPGHEKRIFHVHGNQQIAVNVFEIDPHAFKLNQIQKKVPKLKTPPAGYKGRN